MTDERGNELRAFLRAMRARLRPEDVGLPAAERRRRTAGLRIEEAAALAGVSLTWYSALEGGKGTRVSASLLQRVSDALRLAPAEREMLAALAAPKGPGGAHSVDDTVLHAIVDGFTSGPAFVSDRFWNVQAYNATAGAVYGMSAAAEKNLLIRMLTEPSLRALHEDWERIAQQMVAIAHLAFGHTPEDARGIALVQRLTVSSPEFAEWWAKYGVRNFVPTTTRLNHPTLGRLSLIFTSFIASGMRAGSQPVVIVLQPAADAETAHRLRGNRPTQIGSNP